MDYTSALGTCPICGQDKVQVEGDVKCLMCIGKASGNASGLVVSQEDPGEEALNKLLAKTGIAKIEGGKPPEAIKPNLAVNKPVISAPVHPLSGASIFDALAILRALPMPKDIKQFKQINKAIKILEELGA